jgi:type I restriction enzyme S subunit
MAAANQMMLGEVVRFGNGKAIKPGGTGLYPVYGSNGIIGGSDEFRHENGVVVGRVGAYCGAVLYCPTKFWASDNTLVAYPASEQIDTKFLYYLLTDAKLSRYAGGAAQPLVTQTVLKQVEVRVPPLPIQRRIAGILSAYDALIENNQRRIKILEEMARSLYREWFVNFRYPGHESVPLVPSPLGEIPQGWEVKRLPHCIDINPRVIVPRDGEKPFVPMGSLSNDSMLITDVESRTGNSGAKFQNGDTLFARITPCLENGKTGFVQFLADSDAVAFGSTEFIVLRSHTLTPEFAYCLARSDEFRGIAIKSMSGATGRQRVQERCFDDYRIAQPPRALLNQFSAIVTPSFRLVESLHLEVQNLRRTRDLLLPRLLSGQIDVEAMPS